MKVKNKMATTILRAYTTFCQTYAEPTLLSCDNGGEFEHITTTKIPHPSKHSQVNVVIERFHDELGKISRIFNEDPDVAFHRLNTTNAKLIFHTYLKNTYHDCFNCLMFYETRSFKYNDLVWRRVPPRKRANMKTLSLALTEFSPKLALLHTLSHLISITRGQYQSTSTTSKFFTSRARVTGSSTRSTYHNCCETSTHLKTLPRP